MSGLKLKMLCMRSNTNSMDKSKMKAKPRVLIRWQKYFCGFASKRNFVPETQTCTKSLEMFKEGTRFEGVK